MAAPPPRHRERPRGRGRRGAGPGRTSDVTIPPRRRQCRPNLQVRERGRCQLSGIAAGHRKTHVHGRGHADRRGRDSRPGAAVRRAISRKATALPYEPHPCGRGARSILRPRGVAARGCALLQRGAHPWRQQREGVSRVRCQSITDHDASFAPLVGSVKAGNAGTDVDVPGHDAIGETKLIGRSPDVVATSDNRPRSTRHAGSTARRRTTEVPTGPAGWQRARLCVGFDDASDEEAHYDHGGQSSAVQQPFQQLFFSRLQLALADTQNARRQPWLGTEVDVGVRLSSQARRVGKSAARWRQIAGTRVFIACGST